MKKFLTMLAALSGIGGLGPAAAQKIAPDPVEAAINASSNRPIRDTVTQVARALSNREVAIPSASKKVRDGTSAQIFTGLDKEGNVWLYIYSDAAHVGKVFPSGVSTFTTDFSGLKKIVEANSHFRGIYINSSFPVPRELFGQFFSVPR